MENDKKKKPVSRKINSREKVSPLSMLERAKLSPVTGEREWYNIRRKTIPAPKEIKNGGGIVVPNHFLKGGANIITKSFIPPEAEKLLSPRLVGKRSVPLLRTFKGEKVTPLNQTFLDGNDDRKLFADPSYPWCCIGRISSGGRWGTATLVGKNFVVTASHVVAGLWTPNKPLTETITFVPAMFGSSSLLGPSWSAKVTGIAAWKEINDVAGYDMAICQLDKPMGDWLGYFGSRSYNDDWEDHPWWEHVGYPFDLSLGGTEPSYQFNITINDDDGDSYNTLELETNADTASGQSGGPLWAIFKDGGHQILGVLSGNQNGLWETTNIFAGGSGLNSLVRWGRNNW